MVLQFKIKILRGINEKEKQSRKYDSLKLELRKFLTNYKVTPMARQREERNNNNNNNKTGRKLLNVFRFHI